MGRGVADDAIQTSITFFIGVLIAGLVGLLFLIIYGNLSGNLGFDRVTTTVINESITMGGSGIATINDNTNPNFITWNATLIINGTTEAGDNVTLVEGTDYQIFSANGSIGNLTQTPGFRVTYSVTRKSSAESDTDSVITNLTSGATQFFTFANVWFILLGVTVLIGIVIGLLVLVMRIRGVAAGGGGRKESTRFTS